VSANAGILARLVSLKCNASGEKRNLCGVFNASIMAKVQPSVQRQLVSIDRSNGPLLVLVIVWVVSPARRHHYDLLPNFPIDVIL
jgi:hypothetical protein